MAKSVDIEVGATDKTKRGLSSAQKNLKKTSKEANSLSKNFRNVARATVVMEGPLGGTAGRLSAVATMLGNVSLGAVAFGAGFTAMTAVAYKSITAFAQWELQTLKINQLLEQTQGASGLTGDEIEEMSVRIGRATLASADDVRAASAVLLTFKSIATDSFERTLDVASDLAALTGQDLKQSVIQLGKALDDPATGMSALRRVGVSFTDSQKEMIVTMNKTGDVAGAQSEILALLEGQLGGAGAAAGAGLAGAADAVTESWNLMLVGMAKTGAGGLIEKLLNNVATSLDKIGEEMDPSLQARRSEANAKAWRARIKLGEAIKEESEAVASNTWFYKSNVKAFRKVVAARNEALALIDAEIAAKDAEIAAARRKGVEAQKEIQQTKELSAAKKIADANRKKEEADAAKTSKAGSSFAQKLIDEEVALQTSLLTKLEQEDVFYAEKLAKLWAFNEAGALSEEEHGASMIAATQHREAQITEIKRAEKEKQMAAEEKFKADQFNATAGAFGDLATLMGSHSKKAFEVGKGAAISQAIIKGVSAAISAWDAGMSTGGPWAPAVAAAYTAASIAKTTVQVQKLKAAKFSGAREFGGPVIGGRSYLVGERGPELFTPPRTGSIVNNKTLNNTGGATNIINNTTIIDRGEEYLDRNMEKIWNGMLDKMNENGLGFA